MEEILFLVIKVYYCYSGKVVVEGKIVISYGLAKDPWVSLI